MALLITKNALIAICASPNARTRRFRMGDSIYEINSDRCTECIGHYETPTCQKCARSRIPS
ncbi:4Fe-4S ferredoxin [Enterobacter asburiae]|uniref:4Fe-4S ferredoxin n=1 Tax=Enterobacter asburiae TaxID=61645 RepID=A0A376FJS3_ENTAS|nr:4Fe-4S ferredoxin [Enterobacter asburiae]